MLPLIDSILPQPTKQSYKTDWKFDKKNAGNACLLEACLRMGGFDAIDHRFSDLRI